MNGLKVPPVGGLVFLALVAVEAIADLVGVDIDLTPSVGEMEEEE